MARLLVVEDDGGIRTALVRALHDRGHSVSSCSTGMAGLQEALDHQPDLVVLDLGLPDVDGLTLLSMLRGVSQVPVIVVTAREEDAALVRALDAGADDYVTKPFGSDQLEARIRAVLRRTSSGAPAAGPLEVGELVVDPTTRQATLRGDALDLSRKEFDLLLLLAQRAGEVVSRREILSEVWQQAYGGGDRTLDVHLSWLRRKLGETAAHPRYLRSVRGVGLRLAAPDRD
ncbi:MULTISPECIES: response regulator transcription factor [unclassified Phycicoccus]|uniref:response regulator transcription factor n=1 Tax=unclassified Phycicoccus TaxID=2637926 RepID=UPI00070245D1|nr:MULTISPECIES: response regulator transcription factor [unclassified Phycicoccus]KQU67426.1 two-component system response regulator [Phycicoccus sp. Root101]KQZ90107.1 two-component system response regulator [Phycicoccus sp. Root563]